MNDLSTLIRHVFRVSMFFMSICLMTWALVPFLKPYAAGLVLGTTISLVNGLLLQAQVNKVTRIALENTGKRAGSGFLGRACMVLIGTMLAVRFPAFHLISTISGFFFVQLVTLIIGIISSRRLRLHNEKR